MRLLQLIENLNRTGEGKAAVVGWGRGMGHKGHMYLASSVITQAEEQGADPYFVVSRTVGKDDPIKPEEKMQIYKKVFPKHGHIFHTATDEMPDLTRVLSQLDRHGYTDVTVVVGADQVKGLSYVKQYNGVPDKAGKIPFSFNSLNVIARQETNDPSREEEGPRATPMRDILMDPNKGDDEKFAVWRDAMSPEVSDDQVRDLMHKAHTRMQDFTKPKVKAKKEKATAEGAPMVVMPMVPRPKKAEPTKVRYQGDIVPPTQPPSTEKRGVKGRPGQRPMPKYDESVEGLKEANAMVRSLREGSAGKVGKGGTKPIDKEKKAAMRNATTLPGLNMATGSMYKNYRMGIALAGAPTFPTKIEADNWIGGDPLISSYTEEEFEMVKAAALQVGAGKIENWSGKRSEEVADVNKTSTVAKIKRNKYGI